jgi:predicted metal-binding protein
MGRKGKAMADRITICESCQSDGAPKGAALADQLRSMVQADVATTDCMIVCGKPVTVSFRATGKAAYLFSGIDPDTQAEEIAEFARLYAEAEDGIVNDVRSIGQLRFCLIGRIPA